MDSQIQKRSKKNLRITSCNKVCSVHFEQDNNVKFVNNQIRRLKDGLVNHRFYAQQGVI